MTNDRKINEIHRALLKAASIILKTQNDETLLHHICEELSQNTPFTAVWIGRMEQNRFILQGAGGTGTEHLPDLLPLLNSQALAIQAIDQNRIVWSNHNLHRSEGSPWGDFVHQHAWRSCLACPVHRKQQPWAAIVFCGNQSDLFDAATIELCESSSELLGHGLDEIDLKQDLINLEKKAAQLARSDSLTGIPNRLALEERLTQAHQRCRRFGHPFAIVMFDLDGFKAVNDRFGHNAGDLLLKMLTQWLQKNIRETDFLARLGGDEFVAVLEHLNPEDPTADIANALNRLHQTVEDAFIVGDNTKAFIDLSAGVSLSQPSSNPEQMLSEADSALYQAKHRDHDENWWQHYNVIHRKTTAPLIKDPFSKSAEILLARYHAIIEDVAEQFATAFYQHLSDDEDAVPILNSLMPEEIERLLHAQANHLRFIVHPDTSHEQLLQRAQQIGEIHALVGVNGPMLLRAQTLYRQLLAHQLERLAGREGWKILDILSARLDLDVQTELSAAAALRVDYYEIPETAGSMQETGIDALQKMIERIANLPGMRATLIMTPDADGRFYIVAGAGPSIDKLTKLLQDPAYQVSSDATVPQGQGAGALAWRTLTYQVVDNLAHNEKMSPWAQQELAMGIRSHLVIPIRDAQGRAAANLALYGAYPYQFAQREALSVWGARLQTRFESLWQSLRTPLQPVAMDQGASLRQRLFSDGLRLVFQPVVALNTGRLMKIEALARLEKADGQLISPGVFLPLLGSNELYRLFWQTLRGALETLQSLNNTFPSLQIAVNLPPSSLLEPDLCTRLKDLLSHFPDLRGRVILEILETEDIHQARQHDILSQLKQEGVLLALDDLGAGYGSLLRLIREPVDILKIDQNIVRRLPEDPLPTLTLLWTLINLGKDLQRDVVVEGLETTALIETLNWLEAPLGQGYAFARPMPADAISTWAQTMRPPPSQTITTYAGALARHWKWRHKQSSMITDTYENCPLTHFLDQQGPAADRAKRWHQTLHNVAIAPARRQKVSDQLLIWLEQQVRASA